MLGKAAHYGWKWTSDLTGKLYPEIWKRAQRGEERGETTT